MGQYSWKWKVENGGRWLVEYGERLMLEFGGIWLL